MSEVVIAMRGVNRKLKAKSGKPSVCRLFKPGEEIPADLFTPEELASKLKSGVVRKPGSKEKKGKIAHQPVVATPGKDPIVMNGDGEETDQDPLEEPEG